MSTSPATAPDPAAPVTTDIAAAPAPGDPAHASAPPASGDVPETAATPQPVKSQPSDDTVKDAAKDTESAGPQEARPDRRGAEGTERKPETDAPAPRGTPAHRATPGSEQGIASRSARATEVLAEKAPQAAGANTTAPETKSAEAKPGQAHAPHGAADVPGAQAPLPDTPPTSAAPTATDATALDSSRVSGAAPQPLAAGPVTTTATNTPNAPYAALAPVPVSGLAVEIAAQARDGKSRFEIRLDPPELGRIDVHLHVDRDGTVTSRLVVERSETLDLLKRDAPNLERALQNAGLKTGDQGLEFSLRHHGAGRHQDNGQDNGARGNRVIVADDAQPHGAASTTYGRRLGLGAGIDIRV
jgi:hypothetical protein